MDRYDVVIIGGGLGGLACGTILSKEGMSVLLLERHRVIGGCLQSFRRGAYTLDTGMHYVGSLSEGQIMHQYFKYFGVLDSLRMQTLDENGFDVIDVEGRRYRHAMGYDRFFETLAADFPDEREGLKRYCGILKGIGSMLSPEILRRGKISDGGIEYMMMSAYDTIADCVKNPTLRKVLAGTNGLYGGNRETTSLYEHGIINNSNIEGCRCFVGGSQQLADAFVNEIRRNGGEVRTGAGVEHIHLEGDRAEYVELQDGERIYADNIISSLHPSLTLSLLENNTVIKKAFFTRINSLPNSCGIFTTYLLMKPGSMPYAGSNLWCYRTDDVWTLEGDYKGCNIPYVLISFQPAGNGYSDVVTVLSPMPERFMEPWRDTVTGHRGEEYEEFKRRYGAAAADFACEYLPELRDRIAGIHTASPLTYRDFTGTPDGTAYGIVKDYHNPIVNHLSARMKVSNLFITGQNLNVHGCLGTSISAAVTCSELLGTEYLTKKIGNA
ncbi:MAG: NAD(P)/FAD-dependent oxidoreductase [Alistipes sp.]|nr:NAD(P)/FAD-dependent oxidoreductase [Alistipes sp.]